MSEQSDEGIRKTVDVTLAGVTDERPLGYEQSFSSPVMVMDQKTFDSLWKDGKCDYEGRPYQVAYVNVEDADKYQDDLERREELDKLKDEKFEKAVEEHGEEIFNRVMRLWGY